MRADKSGPISRATQTPTFALKYLIVVLVSVALVSSAAGREIARILRTSIQEWRRGIAIVRDATEGHTINALVDTGGSTELKSKYPKDFQTYYRGLNIQEAIGSDFIATHALTLNSVSSAALRIPLDVRTTKGLTSSFVTCVVAGSTLTMLFDSAAFAWPAGRANATPFGVSLLRASRFRELRNRFPSWQYRDADLEIPNESGKFVHAASLLAPKMQIGARTVGPVLLVERTDDRTFRQLKKLYALDVDGDLGIAALHAAGLKIDYPSGLLVVQSER